MFAAVILFVILLVAMLILAFVRFRDPPVAPDTPRPAGAAAHLPGDRPAAWMAVPDGVQDA